MCGDYNHKIDISDWVVLANKKHIYKSLKDSYSSNIITHGSNILTHEENNITHGPTSTVFSEWQFVVCIFWAFRLKALTRAMNEVNTNNIIET